MAAISDPVRSGIIPSLARPGGNVTGLTLLAPELSAKRLELLHEVLGPVREIAAMWVAGNPNGEFLFTETEAAARSLGIHVHPLKFRSMDDLEPMIRSAAGWVRAVVQLADVILWKSGPLGKP
jgi:putative ABC transport system substrate-binding protein